MEFFSNQFLLARKKTFASPRKSKESTSYFHMNLIFLKWKFPVVIFSAWALTRVFQKFARIKPPHLNSFQRTLRHIPPP